MDHAAEFRRCLTDCDVSGMRALWAHVSPHLAQPGSDAEALATIHRARTETKSIPLRLRAYSHRWLTERGIPSGLPDIFKPTAERMYPRVVDAVGIGVRNDRRHLPLTSAIVSAMSDAVAECYADGRKEPEFVKMRMGEARERVLRS